jgi:hypothetical protein
MNNTYRSSLRSVAGDPYHVLAVMASSTTPARGDRRRQPRRRTRRGPTRPA